MGATVTNGIAAAVTMTVVAVSLALPAGAARAEGAMREIEVPGEAITGVAFEPAADEAPHMLTISVRGGDPVVVEGDNELSDFEACLATVRSVRGRGGATLEIAVDEGANTMNAVLLMRCRVSE